MHFFRASVGLSQRLVRANFRERGLLAASIVQAAVWALLSTYLFSVIFERAGYEERYLQFAMPGLVVMSALSGSSRYGLKLLEDIQNGVLDRFMLTPVPRCAIIAGYMLGSAVQETFRGALVLTVAVCFGGKIVVGGGVVVALSVVGIFSAALAGVSTVVTLLLFKNKETASTLLGAFTLPLTYLSSMLVPVKLMPEVAQRLAAFNPVEWATVVTRSAISGEMSRAILSNSVLLVTLTALAWLVGTVALERHQRLE